MDDIKAQLVAGKEIITDMRGDNFVGKEQGDHHRTFAEVSNAPAEAVALVLEEGPAINAAAAKFFDLCEKVGIPKDRILAGLSVIMGEDVSDAEFFAPQIRVYTHD